MSTPASGAQPVTRELAAFASRIEWTDLPASTIDMAKRLLLDGIGCLLVGGRGATGLAATATVRRLGGAAQATLLTDLQAASVRDAAFVNGICLYSVGLNDVHKPAGSHPGGCIIPVLLAVGEWRRSPGTLLLAAMAGGYEVAGRIGRAVYPSHRERGFHPTGTCGTFGAAAAAGRLLGLDAAQMASAFGIAGSQAAGLYECHHDGTSTMIFHAGRAAQNGVEAVLLTQAGFTGPATVLEGSKGFFQATANTWDVAAAMADFGQRYEIEATSFRPYFGCNSTLAASGATASIVKAGGIAPGQVAAVTVSCHPVVAQDNGDGNPQTMLAARLSLPFNVALVLARGDVLAGDLEDAALQDAGIRGLLPKIRVTVDPACPRYGSRVRLETADGRTFDESIAEPRGSDQHPLLWNDVVEKFHRLVQPLGNVPAQRAVVDAVAQLETIDAVALIEVLRRAQAR